MIIKSLSLHVVLQSLNNHIRQKHLEGNGTHLISINCKSKTKKLVPGVVTERDPPFPSHSEGSLLDPRLDKNPTQTPVSERSFIKQVRKIKVTAF